MVHLATVLSTTAVVASLVPSIVVAVPIQSSSSEGLVEREPFLPLLGLIGGAVSMFKGRKRDVQSDEFLDVAERAPEPFLPLLGLIGGAVSMFKGRKRDLSDDDLELISRLNADELADLVQRNPEPFLPLLGLIGGAVSMFKGRKREFDEGLDLISRAEPSELADLMARNPEPFLPLLGLIGGAVSMFKGRKRDFTSDDFDGVFEREIAQWEEYEMREYDDDEIIARGWSSLEELD